LKERFVEFFKEHGHRWFDLKRMGQAKTEIAPVKLNWKDMDLLLPMNPNLKPQNSDY
jgi:hypothetical protein